MSEAATHNETETHGHDEHLEVWPDAGITETSKSLPWPLLLCLICFGLGMGMAYWNQFVNHTAGYPKFGSGYLFLNEEAQYPGKINPTITMQAEVTFTLGKEEAMMLEAEGGRVGRQWSLAPGDVLPPGLTFTEKEEGMAIAGTPTKAGPYTFTLRCHSGLGYAEKQIVITVEGK